MGTLETLSLVSTLEETLSRFEDDMHLDMMVFDEEERGTRFTFWVGEQFDDRTSFRRLLRESELTQFESLLRLLTRSGLLTTCMDDGWFHLTFGEVFSHRFLSGLEFDS
tara:strand:+ start:384 stop:710 length:327 start_codon:yes stop_codon:yes gene_type:complete